MIAFVLDNSVTMRWYFQNSAHAYADGVLKQLVYAEAIVPILWRYEVSNVLARSQKDGVLTYEQASAFLDKLSGLNITVESEGENRIFTDVHRLAVAHRLTSYDAAYLEVAVRRNLPLATLDAELIAAAKAAGAGLLPVNGAPPR